MHDHADLPMAGELQNTSSRNRFVIFGKPDITLWDASLQGACGKLRRHIVPRLTDFERF
jgi:hypothetical protein